MKPRTKRVWMAYYNLRKRLGLKAWYHSTEPCHDHLIPRRHRVEMWHDLYPRGIELCGKGDKDYFTGEPVHL